jgi:hypothetical protein
MDILQSPETSELSQKWPAELTVEIFKERSFCIITDDMKAKMLALGITEDDLAREYYDDWYERSLNIWTCLELISRYTPQLQSIQNFGIRRYDTEDEIKRIKKRELIDVLLYAEEFLNFLERFPELDISTHLDEMSLGRLLKDVRRWLLSYDFSFDVYREFLNKCPVEIREHSVIDGNYEPWSGDAFKFLIDMYQELSKGMGDTPWLFDRFLRLFAETGETYIYNIYQDWRRLFHGIERDHWRDDGVEKKTVTPELISNLIHYTTLSGKYAYRGDGHEIVQASQRGRDKESIDAGFRELGREKMHILWGWWSWFFEYSYVHYPENWQNICNRVYNAIIKLDDRIRYSYTHQGLWFLLAFLKISEDSFWQTFDTLESLISQCKNEKIKDAFLRHGFPFLIECVDYIPESFWIIGVQLVKIFNRHHIDDYSYSWENFFTDFMKWLSHSRFSEDIKRDPTFYDALFSFLDTIWGDRDALRVIRSLGKEFVDIQSVQDSLIYLLRYKRKKVIPFIKKLLQIRGLDLSINLDIVLMGGTSLEMRSDTELHICFRGENIEDTLIWQNFHRLWWEKMLQANDMRRWITSIMNQKWGKFDKTKILPTLKKIQDTLANLIFQYLEKTVQKKIHRKLKSEFHLKNDFDDVLLTEEVFQLYAIYRSIGSLWKDKKQASEFLQKYLSSEMYNWTWEAIDFYPYNKEENIRFMEAHFPWKNDVLLYKNEKTFEIVDISTPDTSNKKERITHHLRVANAKIAELEICDEKWDIRSFTDHFRLMKFFENTLKKESKSYDIDVIDDIELQVRSIRELLSKENDKKISSIRIYNELNPMRIVMMGTWIDGSCLHLRGGSNNWSIFPNAIEVNKMVLYAEDENGNVIARMLVGIDKEWWFELHPIYYKAWVRVKLDTYFQTYTAELASTLWSPRQESNLCLSLRSALFFH